MIAASSLPPLPRFSVDHLNGIGLELPLLARLAVSGHGSAPRDVLEKALAPFYEGPGQFAAALAEAVSEGRLVISRKGHCRITEAGRKHVESILGNLLARPWAETITSLAAAALGIDVADGGAARQYFARRDNMECAALARLYGLSGLDTMPSREDVRSALLRSFVAARLPECESAFTEISMRTTSRDPVGRAVMLGAAGLNRGTHRDAETVLLRKALGLHGETGGGIAEALIKGAMAKSAQRNGAALAGRDQINVAAAVKDMPRDESPLAAFADTVRDLAKTLRTDPFAGRVAIAQVYDAGLADGLDFGTLEGFKGKVAEAGRAGLLDLERYDVAGPMDSALRERSRTAFGRDERHFIVNEWI